ncbi:MAG: single-stranded-DNA-specific exonuclease RecJ [Candidatus Omnitrophica bacterium]|nr:single-stranded-DNA-specific exonuclease RecJ [Candidatus Omnitrophota bacterium]MDD5351994.1 single-stranded-DNA-specific exonuclease RecJ [Candidatus Omnitrophota bacterium]MDD5551048.1 single-stranded-DNA-specific exonuclease RecJ [Candidatus Omnitrophota bacterium]
MQKKWSIREPNLEAVENIQRSLGLNKVLSQILANRGIKTDNQARRFLKSDLEDLHSPLALKDMDKAISRIKKAISAKEKIFIFSDYDVDGITSCAILEKELKELGAIVSHYIPHRTKEGYGLNLNAVKLAHKENIQLFIALDCGIKSFKEVELLNKYKIDTIIVDHHRPEEDKIPCAFAVINPKQRDCSYEFKDLAAVGLVYKLICALQGKNSDKYLDLVTLGTIADVVPLVDENRIIVKKGLEVINNTSNFGIKALIEASGLKDKQINPGSVSFILAPRINASGRVDTAETSLSLLLSQDYDEARQLAAHLNTHNRLRQKIEEEVLREALELVDKMHFKDCHVIVLAKEGWHIGVLGIVASKIADRFFRPTIIISLKDGVGKGSGRSIPGFHLFDALLSCSKYLKDFGGHSHAVGLSIDKDKLEDFQKDLDKIAGERFEPDMLKPVLEIDAQLPLMLLNHDLIGELQKLGPFGLGNPRPLFCSHNLTIKSNAVLLGRDTIKFWVTDEDCTYEAIGFGLRDFAPYILPSKRVDLAYNLSLDNWQDANSILLEVKDLKFAS